MIHKLELVIKWLSLIIGLVFLFQASLSIYYIGNPHKFRNTLKGVGKMLAKDDMIQKVMGKAFWEEIGIVLICGLIFWIMY